jgi:serine/threonine protein kinase
MPLTKLSTSIFTATSKETTALNKAIDEYNARPSLMTLELVAMMISGANQNRWPSKAAEIKRLQEAIDRERPTHVQAVATDLAGVSVMGATRVADLSPTRWIETLSPQAPSLEGVQVDGSGKKGAQGNTYFLVLPSGKRLFAKTPRGTDVENTECRREYEVYRRLYTTAGDHPNLVTVWGWADMRIGVLHEIGIVMERINGPDGRTMQARLKESWDLGIISTAEYWSSIQYIGRCHVKVIQHLRGAGWAHNDIKPENYVIDSETGEVIVVDLGGAGLLGGNWNAVTKEYLAPEMRVGSSPDRLAPGTAAADVFSVGASIAHAAEAAHAFHEAARPNRGLVQAEVPFHNVRTPAPGLAAGRYKNPFEYGAETDYTRQLTRMMNSDPLERERTLDETSTNRFLNDSILNDPEIREVLKGVASGSRRSAWEEKWRRAGKPLPTLTMVDRVSLTTQLKDKMRVIPAETQRLPDERDMTAARVPAWEGWLVVARKQLEEAAKVINQANAFGIDTRREALLVRRHLRYWDQVETLIKGAAWDPNVATRARR